MGSHMSKPTNKSMVDRLVDRHSYIQSASVEGAFRAVDRAMYFDLGENDPRDPYDEDPWRRGNLHLSAPCIYARVVEALELRPGMSFLNLGSGTGYLNTIIGLLVGPHGLNHGIEYHSDVVDYAYKRLQQFKQESHAIDKYHFSEPHFIQGNCINLNPNSRYDRIYLGAACLPELEEFMKKLIRPNGGILVMPYENHLVRYKRNSETLWISEKLMDVNFTLMIRQGDKESIIDMPLAQAKSLKELCRISIRQHLRDKIDSVNPSLKDSDNCQARRLRKAKAKAILAREERRDFKCCSKRSKGTRRHNADCNCACRARCSTNPGFRQPEAQEPTNSSSNDRIVTRSASRRLGENNQEARGNRSTAKYNCPSLRDRVLNNNLQESNPPQNVSNDSRVVTRSASRRLEAADVSNEDGAAGPTRDSRARGGDLETEPAETSGSESSGSEDRGNSNIGLERPAIRRRNNNCARTRPYDCSSRSGRATLPFSASSLADRVIGPSDLLPFHRRIARIIDSSSSSSSSSSSDGLDLRTVEEYDYIGRHMVLNWPGFVRHTLQAEESDFSLDDSISSSDFSGSNLSDLILDGNASEVSSDASWDSFFESINNPENQSDQLSTSSSQFQTPTGFTDDEEDYNNNDDILAQISHRCSNLTQPGTSGLGSTCHSESASTSRATMTNEKNKREDPKTKLPEMSTRCLRSNRHPVEKISTLKTPSTSKAAQVIDPPDRPVPGCSRADRTSARETSDEKCDDKYSHISGPNNRHRKHRPVQHRSNPASPSSNRTTESTHSSMRISSADSQGRLNPGRQHRWSSPSNPRSGMFTGRVLLTAGLSTTLSIASRQFMPATRRSGSFRLFERRLNNSSALKRQNRCHPMQLSHKRKRRSSSESSESSNSGTPSRHKGNRCMRRRCGCPQSPTSSDLAGKQRVEAESQRRSNNNRNSSRAKTTNHNSSSNATSAADPERTNMNPTTSEQSPLSPSGPPTSSSRHNITSRNQRSVLESGLPLFLGSSTSRSDRLPQYSGEDSGSTSHHHRQVGDDSLCADCRAGTNVRLESVCSGNPHYQHHHHHHHHFHHHHHCYHNRSYHHHHRNCPEEGVESCNRNHPKEVESRRKADREERRRQRGENECERYHNHLSSYIRQLPLPPVLHSFLDYDRSL